MPLDEVYVVPDEEALHAASATFRFMESASNAEARITMRGETWEDISARRKDLVTRRERRIHCRGKNAWQRKREKHSTKMTLGADRQQSPELHIQCTLPRDTSLGLFRKEVPLLFALTFVFVHSPLQLIGCVSSRVFEQIFPNKHR